jgi:hypothetical protein
MQEYRHLKHNLDCANKSGKADNVSVRMIWSDAGATAAAAAGSGSTTAILEDSFKIPTFFSVSFSQRLILQIWWLLSFLQGAQSPQLSLR